MTVHVAPGGVTLGWAVLVSPMKPKLKPPGTKRLKLHRDILLSISALKINLRRYTWGRCASTSRRPSGWGHSP